MGNEGWRRLKRIGLRLLRSPLDYALPPRCPSCGVIVGGDDQFCAGCWLRLDRMSGPLCAHCRFPLGDNALSGDFCAPCLAKPPAYGAIYAPLAYDRASAAIVLKLKYAGRIGLARLIARPIAQLLPAQSMDWIVVPVPLHRWRLWRRGYNQALLIAQALAENRELLRDGLVRSRATRPLKGLNPAQRKRALDGAIGVDPRHRSRLAGRTVLLVDDVFTSGATASACARALRRAGVEAVHVACWARVVPGRTGTSDVDLPPV